MMGTPSGLVTVVPHSLTDFTGPSASTVSCHPRRFGPVNYGLEGVSQPAIPGKYVLFVKLSLCDKLQNFSTTPTARSWVETSSNLERTQPSSTSMRLDRTVESLMEAPSLWRGKWVGQVGQVLRMKTPE